MRISLNIVMKLKREGYSMAKKIVKQICSSCNGTGRASWKEECWRCSGTGMVPVWERSVYYLYLSILGIPIAFVISIVCGVFEKAFRKKAVCPQCNGTGHKEKWGRCSCCNGYTQFLVDD